MKTKLLRKVRKRFQINYYPNGYDFGSGYETNVPCVALIDTKFWTWQSCPIIHRELLSEEGSIKELAFKNCLHYLEQVIVNTYDKYGTRRNKKPRKTEEKLWYKE